MEHFSYESFFDIVQNNATQDTYERPDRCRDCPRITQLEDERSIFSALAYTNTHLTDLRMKVMYHNINEYGMTREQAQAEAQRFIDNYIATSHTTIEQQIATRQEDADETNSRIEAAYKKCIGRCSGQAKLTTKNGQTATICGSQNEIDREAYYNTTIIPVTLTICYEPDEPELRNCTGCPEAMTLLEEQEIIRYQLGKVASQEEQNELQDDLRANERTLQELYNTCAGRTVAVGERAGRTVYGITCTSDEAPRTIGGVTNIIYDIDPR